MVLVCCCVLGSVVVCCCVCASMIFECSHHQFVRTQGPLCSTPTLLQGMLPAHDFFFNSMFFFHIFVSPVFKISVEFLAYFIRSHFISGHFDMFTLFCFVLFYVIYFIFSLFFCVLMLYLEVHRVFLSCVLGEYRTRPPRR